MNYAAAQKHQQSGDGGRCQMEEGCRSIRSTDVVMKASTQWSCLRTREGFTTASLSRAIIRSFILPNNIRPVGWFKVLSIQKMCVFIIRNSFVN